MFFFAIGNRQSRRGARNDEPVDAGEALRRVGGRIDQDRIGFRRERHVTLGAVEDVSGAVAPGGDLLRGEIEIEARLHHGRGRGGEIGAGE